MQVKIFPINLHHLTWGCPEGRQVASQPPNFCEGRLSPMHTFSSILGFRKNLPQKLWQKNTDFVMQVVIRYGTSRSFKTKSKSNNSKKNMAFGQFCPSEFRNTSQYNSTLNHSRLHCLIPPSTSPLAKNRSLVQNCQNWANNIYNAIFIKSFQNRINVLSFQISTLS